MTTEDFYHTIIPLRDDLLRYAVSLTASSDDIGREDLRVEARDQIGMVSDIIDHLPPLQQRLFRMKEIEGYTADEIMRITGCSAANLRKNLSRARIAIRTQFIHITRQGGNSI